MLIGEYTTTSVPTRSALGSQLLQIEFGFDLAIEWL